MTGADARDDAAAFCASVVREHDFSHYAATLFVGPDVRRAMVALYAFNVEIIRIRDLVSQPLPGEVRLQWWSDMLAGDGHGGVEGNPVAAELLSAVRRYGLPVERLTRLIDEHQFDLYNDPMPTMAALDGYLDDTTAALFALAARTVGPASPELDHLVHHAGLAQGMVQVMTSLPHDAARRQLFIPLELLQRHGVDQEEVFAGKPTPKIRAAWNDLAGEARRHLDTALQLLDEAPRQVRPLFLPLALVRRDLARMARADTDPFRPQTRSHLATLWTLWRASKTGVFRGR